MRPEELWGHYPVLYHIAWGGSWPSIREHGLLSTKALLRSYGKGEGEIRELTQQRRSHWVEIDCPGRPKAVLRDQKPLSDGGLRRALPDSVEPWQWYDLINSMVFFWPTKVRLKTMISASAYRNVTHDVLVVDTRGLVGLGESNLRLSRMNSGCTTPFAHRRDIDIFKRIEEYSFPEKPSRSVVTRAVAEVCVLDGVQRIAEAVVDVKRGDADEVMNQLTED